MINLFEYQNKVVADDIDLESLDLFLDEIWVNREVNSWYNEKGESKAIETQRFIQTLHKTNELKSNKYVGVVQFEGHTINLLPKVFYKQGKEYSKDEVGQMQNHILWWLSYCRKIKFPSYQTTLGDVKSDFFEVLIYLFAKYTRKLLATSIYQNYEEQSSELNHIKGRLNTNEYIRQNLSKGNWHKLNCSYDAFVMDNKFNRIIKYVANLLFTVTQNSDNKKYLREILFFLDEVSDEQATASQCATISFNPVFEEFTTVRDYCQLFLSNAISFSYKNELKLFAFLLPMEYVFEDFIFGFIEKELEEITAKAQVSDKYLDTKNTFNLKPDLLIKTGTKNYIADTKYKIVYTDESDPKKGISQTDLYQMLAYAIRFKVDEIILFYPNTINNYQEKIAHLTIEDEWGDGKKIDIHAYQIPFLSNEVMSMAFKGNVELETLFSGLRNELITELSNSLM
ncbi:McrC family protein [Flammeovirga kamogawensis]|uniref:McrC family protein n=1 Tax=Flammeovirga kamogawensis TaxID=373891 RepID=A0ABX8H2G6_9BACT|nr:hypothetical protein [Flammeovirga kamogawensis]MBB6462389.1 5-methylcytosine-specific restriction enzyme subunit McrC [Flammeovirga kamogawensis]QWG09502.1 McrC family protein [Flammeovirga kamogawensis]TRX65018.1 hypothetical protein EO216_21025 [Flammeovirga kamogawensis]